MGALLSATQCPLPLTYNSNSISTYTTLTALIAGYSIKERFSLIFGDFQLYNRNLRNRAKITFSKSMSDLSY